MPTIYNKDNLVATTNVPKAVLDDVEAKLNVLKSFRTYSYHHILAVANTTEAMDALNDSMDMKDWLHPVNDKYTPIPAIKGSGSYIILINTMTDADFLIESVEIENVTNPLAGQSSPNSSFVEGAIEISEPAGVQFFNVIKNACDALDSDPTFGGLTFLLKTVFVGYSDASNGKPAVTTVMDVNPIHFNFTDMNVEFNEAGSLYHTKFVGGINGVSRMPMFSKIQQANIKGGSVGGALKMLETRLNKVAKKSHQDLIKQINESNNTAPGSTTKSPIGRPVTYKINVDPEFAAWPLDNVNVRNTDSTNAQLGTPVGIDIDTAISDVMYASSKLSERMNKDLKQGLKHSFAIDSVMQSTLTSVDVTYNVTKLDIPAYVKDNTAHTGQLIDPNVGSRYVLEFDYIFTGHNTEILEYNMRMNMGFAFFNEIISNNNIPGAFRSSSGNVAVLGSGAGSTLNNKSTVMRNLTPVPTPSMIADPAARNKVEPSKTADFRIMMARQAAKESCSVDMTITGIPWILDAFNPTLADALNYTVSYKSQLPLVKVKVKMPSAGNDFKTKGPNGNNYAEDFWYDGYFNILSVTSTFRGGQFSQVLHLNAVPNDEMVEPSSAETPGLSQSQKYTASPLTAEQKAKQGITPAATSPQVLLNCSNVAANAPITFDVAKRTMLSPSFTLAQLIIHAANLPITNEILNNLCLLADQLEQVQNLLGHNIIINSGYRSPSYNASLSTAQGIKGVSKTSDHMKGIAADFYCPAFGSPAQIYAFLQTNGSSLNIRQCIHERNSASNGPGWVHISFNIGGYPPLSGPKFFSMVV